MITNYFTKRLYPYTPFNIRSSAARLKAMYTKRKCYTPRPRPKVMTHAFTKRILVACRWEVNAAAIMMRKQYRGWCYWNHSYKTQTTLVLCAMSRPIGTPHTHEQLIIQTSRMIWHKVVEFPLGPSLFPCKHQHTCEQSMVPLIYMK